MNRITSDCGAARSLGIKWPESPRGSVPLRYPSEAIELELSPEQQTARDTQRAKAAAAKRQAAEERVESRRQAVCSPA